MAPRAPYSSSPFARVECKKNGAEQETAEEWLGVGETDIGFCRRYMNRLGGGPTVGGASRLGTSRCGVVGLGIVTLTEMASIAAQFLY
jgi:hypothetical protein